MASAPLEFQQKLTLRHIASVKIIQMLWRQSEAREDAKKFLQSNIARSKSPYNSKKKLLRLVIRKLLSFLERWNIPGGMKNDLSVFLVEMMVHAVNWLAKTVEAMINEDDRNCSKKMAFFVDNFSWDDVGCHDGHAILKAYVSDKDTVDFRTWCQLCYYCIEEDITRLSDTIDWDNCREFTKAYFPIYWYQKIHGKFPTKKMFIPNEFSVYVNEKRRGVYNEETIIQNLISESVFEGSISAVKYFRKAFGDDDKFQKLFSEGGFFFTSYPEMMVYLMGEVKDEALLQSFCASGDQFTYLLGWPWILFVDTWLNKIFTMSAPHFRLLFEFIHNRIQSERDEVGKVEYGRRKAKGLYSERFYEPFRKVWMIFCEKFGGNRQFARDIFWKSFQTEDTAFCRIILDGLANGERRFFLNFLGVSIQRFPTWRVDREFRQEFLREVLVCDEERQLFEIILL